MRTPAPSLAKAFGQAVRSRRRALGLSQEELAWRAGLNRTYVTDVERGARNVSLATMEKLARALKSPLFMLLRHAERAWDIAPGTAGREPA